MSDINDIVKDWDKEKWMSMASNSECNLFFRIAPDVIRNDHEVMKEYLLTQHKNYYAASNIEGVVSESLLDNSDFMLDCILANSDTVSYASDRLKNDKDFAINIINEITEHPSDSTDLGFLWRMEDKVIEDREVMLHSLDKCRWNNSIHDRFFYYCGEGLRGNPEFVLEATAKIVEANIRVNWEESDDRKEEYKNFRKYDEKCYSRISEELLNNKEFCIKLVSVDPIAYGVLSEELQKDIEVASAAYEADNDVVPLLIGEIFQNKEFALKAVHLEPMMLREVSSDLRADRDVMFAAITSEQDFHFDVFYNTTKLSLEPELLCDREFMLQAAKSSYSNSQFASHKLRDDPEFVLEARAFAFMSDRLKREVGNQDVEQCLTSIVNKNKLENELSKKSSKADRLVSSIDENAEAPVIHTRSTRQKI